MSKKVESLLNNSDVDVITLALLIVPHLKTSTDEQAEVNCTLAASVAEKLHLHKSDFSANEIRIMSVAIDACCLAARNSKTDLISDIDDSYRKKLSRCIFELDRLSIAFNKTFFAF